MLGYASWARGGGTCTQNSSHQQPVSDAVLEPQLPAHEVLQSVSKSVQQSDSPAHHESQKQPDGAAE